MNEVDNLIILAALIFACVVAIVAVAMAWTVLVILSDIEDSLNGKK